MRATPSGHIKDDCVHILKLGLWGIVAIVSLLIHHRARGRWHRAWSRQQGKFCILTFLFWSSSHPSFSVPLWFYLLKMYNSCNCLLWIIIWTSRHIWKFLRLFTHMLVHSHDFLFFFYSICWILFTLFWKLVIFLLKLLSMLVVERNQDII